MPSDSPQVVIESLALSGASNMAEDERMLESAVAGSDARLRFYRWSEQTLSLGYFQKDEEIPKHLADLPRVRRLSGGGAILHEHEWTYSLALPARHPLCVAPSGIYNIVNDEIVASLNLLNVEASLADAESGKAHKPFLCFERRSVFDILIAGHKVVGSAQRRRKGAVLQHGTIMLEQASAAPHLPGICDLVLAFDSELFLDALSESIAKRLHGEK